MGVVLDEGSVLIGSRRHPPLSGYAEFPGGRVRPGERADAAAVREVREECGLEVTVERLLRRTRFSYPHAVLDLHFFLCRPVSPGRPRSPFTWVPTAALGGFRFPAANAGLVATLRSLPGGPSPAAGTSGGDLGPTTRPKRASSRRCPPR